MNTTAGAGEIARAEPENTAAPARRGKVTVRVNIVPPTDRRAKALDDWMERVAARMLAEPAVAPD